MITELKECRYCKSNDLEIVLDLGLIFPSGFLKSDEKVSEDMKAPITLCMCKECGLVQLKHTIDLDLMYRQYWYSSSLNRSMVASLKEVVDDIENRIDLTDDDTVVDIGCNDGTLLSLYSKKLFNKVGFEPAHNIHPIKDSVTTWIPEYFSKEQYRFYQNHPKLRGMQAKIVTAIAMFYDLPDPLKFVNDVKSILADDGIFVIQFTDLVSMFKASAFDNICHEHLEYYKLRDVVNILNDAGLRVIDVSYNNVNGGSIRVTAAHFNSKYETKDVVVTSLVNEFNYLSGYTFDDFKFKIEATKLKVKGFLDWAKTHDYRIYVLGASTKGNTLMQICEFSKELTPYAAEVNKDKFGLRTVGTDIEIISEEDALLKNPKYFIVPVWHFKESLLNSPRIKEYLFYGGSLIFPLPEFTIVTKNGEWKL